MNLMAGHQCSIIHQLDLEACVDVKNEGNQSSIEIILTSCTRSYVRNWSLFSITYNYKTNH